jgi:hypothetical protein
VQHQSHRYPPPHTRISHPEGTQPRTHVETHIQFMCLLPHAALAKALKKARAIEAGNSKQTKDQHKIGRSTGAELGFLHLAPVSDSR